MSNRYHTQKDGITYEMGVSIDEVGKGDVVKVGSGQLENIVSIAPSGKWDQAIRTESGNIYGMLDVLAYGKREGKD